MSKNVVIEEGGAPKTLGGTQKVNTRLSGGGSQNWVPEDGVRLQPLSVNKNGTVTAESVGAYGFDRVTVNVPPTAAYEFGGNENGQGGEQWDCWVGTLAQYRALEGYKVRRVYFIVPDAYRLVPGT